MATVAVTIGTCFEAVNGAGFGAIFLYDTLGCESDAFVALNVTVVGDIVLCSRICCYR